MATTTTPAHYSTPVEAKDYSHHSSETATGRQSPSMAPGMSAEEHLNHIKTNGSISMSPEMFEKLYLAPEQKVKGELRRTFANPTGLYVFAASIVNSGEAWLLTRSKGPSSAWSCHYSHSHAISWVGEELEAMVQRPR